MSSFASQNAFGNESSAISLGEAVKKIRETAGYSIEDLSLTCGLTVAEIQAIESGEDHDETRLARIAGAMQVPLSALGG
jgi:transcriptional regulator with XRE-family HTH domain